MQIHQLQYFCAVARHGTFTRASEVEHVAQPSLSQQILKLEDELGAKLFDRLPRSARLTVFGRAFLPKAERILREFGDAKMEMQEMAGEDKGEVALGVIPTIAAYLLPPLLTGFAQAHARIKVQVMEDTTQALLERLHQGSMDLGIVALPVAGAGAEIDSRQLFAEPLYAALPAGHPRASQKSVKLSDLDKESFLLLKEGHCFRDTMIAACRTARVKPNVVFESGQFATILAMVSAGMGVSAVPAMAVQPSPGCCFVPIEGRQSVRQIGVIRLRHHFETRAQRLFMEHLLDRWREKPGREAGGFRPAKNGLAAAHK